MRRKVILIVFILSWSHFLLAQCVINCNSNVGVYSTNDARTIGYDNMGSAFHSTYSIEEAGNRVWGEQMFNDGVLHLYSPKYINSGNFPGLTGNIYHIGIGSYNIYNAQLIILTSTGLFVSGEPNNVISSTIKNTSGFQKISVNGKADGLPSGISPDSVKMMFVTFKSIIITTCGGRVFVLSMDTRIRGGKGAGTNTSWSQVLQSAGVPLNNVIAARGCARIGYALKADSTIWTWGDNVLLGNGTSSLHTDTAMQMTLPSGVTGIKMIQATRDGYSANSASYYLLATNKQVYSLGSNDYGQLGDRTTSDRLVWVNCRYQNNTIISNAAWISTNEHDPFYPSLALLNTSAQIFTCGNNNRYMAGRITNNGINHLGIPTGISATDTILFCETGGHTTAFIKIRTPRYGYVGHHISGSVGNGSNSDGELSSVDFITPPIISICGTKCDTPLIFKVPMNCNSTQSRFIIKNKIGNKIFYRLNYGKQDSLIIGAGDSAVITVQSPNSNTVLLIEKLISTKFFCNLDLLIRDSVIFKGKYNIKDSIQLCRGDSILWRGQWRKSTKTYSDSLKTHLGCDSILSLKLEIVDSFVTRLYDTICKTKSKLFNGSYRTTSGVFKDTLYSVKGCDSFIYLQLTVLDTIRKDSYVSICYYDSIQFNNKILKIIGIYKDTLVGANGCDYFLYLHLKVNDSSTKKTFLNVCKGQTIFYKNQYLSNTGIYSDTLRNQYGCDSFDYLHLSILDTSSKSIFDTTCYNAPVLFNGQMITTAGIYKDTLMNKQNCDSFIYLHLTLQQALFTNLTINLCKNQTYRFKGFDLDTSGIYYDTLLSSRGCDSFITLNLIVHPLPQVDAGPDQLRINCEGDSVRLGKSNLIDVDYLWTPNIELDDANTALPWCKTTSKRQYYLTAKNKITGCISKDSVTIDITNSQLTGTKTTKNLNCFNDSSGELRIIATRGYMPYSYASTTKPYQTVNTITNLKATKNSYYYIRDAKGCVYRDTFSLSEPNAILIQNIKKKDLLCTNDSTGEIEVVISGGTKPYRFQWDRNLPNLLVLNKLDGGSYRIHVIDTNNCIESKTINLFEPNQLELNKVIIIQNPCFQDSVGSIAVTAKGGTPAYKYRWSTGSIEPKITKLRAGSYKLTLTDTNNCNFTYSDSLVDPPLLWIDTIYRTDLNCEENASIDIFAKGGTPFYTYSIDSGNNYSRLSKDYVFKIGKYYVAVKDKNQCLSRDTVSIKGVEHIKIDVSPEDTLIRMNEWVQLKYRVTKGDSNAIQSLRWSPSAGLSCADCSNPTVHGYVSETYTLEVRYNENCLTKDKVSIRYKEENYYIPNAFTPASENPENNQVKIYSNNVLKSKLVIFNRWGEKVFEGLDAHRIGWNGIYKGIPAPMSVYVYYAEIVYLNGRKIFTSGDVTLIR